jgi:hypothetical protein
MDGSQYVCFKRRHWLLVGGANQRLGGKMKDNLRRELRHRVAHRDLIADITANAGHLPFEAAQFGEIWRGVRRQREACGSRAEPTQPHAQPSALETGVAGDQHPFVPPEFYVGIDRSVSRLRASGNRARLIANSCVAPRNHRLLNASTNATIANPLARAS